MDNLKNNLGQHLPIGLIYPSDTNPRKRFPEEMLNELAESIRQHGVMQPILVRPITQLAGMPDGYEIVAGECRYRASTLAKQETIPAIIRELDDVEAMKLQVIENIHRTDLHPLEEANGFKQLLESAKWTIDDIIATVGKSRSYVYASLKLTEMCAYAQDAFYDGKLKRETAILIARIPGEKLQTQAVKEITKPDQRGESMSFRAAQSFLRERYMLDLLKAPFDLHSATLCPVAGSCLSCPKRSGNYPELFNDIESADVCTDPDCFGQKKAAHVVFLQQSGKTIVTGEEAEKIAPYGAHSYITNGYDRADDFATGTGKHWGELLGDDMPAPIIVADSNNNLIEVYKETDLKIRLQEKIDRGELNLPSAPPSEYAIQQARREKLIAEETADRKLMFKALHDKLYSMTDAELPYIQMLEVLIEHNFSMLTDRGITALQELYDCQDQDNSDFLQAMMQQPKSPSDLIIFLIEVLAARQVIPQWDYQDDCVNDPEDLLFLLDSVDIQPSDVFKANPAPTPPTAAPAKETSPPEKATEEAKAESHGEISETEASMLKTTEIAAQVDAKPLPPAMQRIKDKALAKKAKKASPPEVQKESAKADVKSAPAAKASRETTAQPA